MSVTPDITASVFINDDEPGLPHMSPYRLMRIIALAKTTQMRT